MNEQVEEKKLLQFEYDKLRIEASKQEILENQKHTNFQRAEDKKQIKAVTNQEDEKTKQEELKTKILDENLKISEINLKISECNLQKVLMKK